MFKVSRFIGIAGSPRRGGNSTTLLKAVLDGAAALSESASGPVTAARLGHGASPRRERAVAGQVIHLNDLRFRGCQACRLCAPEGRCIIQDALTPVFAALRLADVWVLASPIYYDGVSGQMKTFFDRCRHLTWRGDKLEPQLTGKRAAAVIVTYEDKPRDDYRDVANRLAGYLKWMGDFDPIEVLSEGRLGPAGAAAERPDLLAAAREVGEGLVRRLGDRAAAGPAPP